MYVGESVLGDLAGGIADPVARITLALSPDAGASWEYRRVAEDPAVLAWDYADLAVAPDTGRLYITAQAVTLLGSGPWFWTSGDGGLTWDRKPLVLGPGVLDYVAARVSAGPQGQVLVTAIRSIASLATGRGLYVIRSVDEGATFAEPVQVSETGNTRSGPAIARSGAGTDVAVVFATQDGIQVSRSSDGGASWTARETMAAPPSGLDPGWVVFAADGQGGVAALAFFEATDPLRHAVTFLHSDAAGTRSETHLVAVRDGHPAPPSGTIIGSGNEYGGIAFASDGTVWLAWADVHAQGIAIAWVHLAPSP